jgi:hypothetical protein
MDVSDLFVAGTRISVWCSVSSTACVLIVHALESLLQFAMGYRKSYTCIVGKAVVHMHHLSCVWTRARDFFLYLSYLM